MKSMLTTKQSSSTVRIVGNHKIQIDQKKGIYYKTVTSKYNIELLKEDDDDDDGGEGGLDI